MQSKLAELPINKCKSSHSYGIPSLIVVNIHQVPELFRLIYLAQPELDGWQFSTTIHMNVKDWRGLPTKFPTYLSFQTKLKLIDVLPNKAMFEYYIEQYKAVPITISSEEKMLTFLHTIKGIGELMKKINPQ